MTTMGCEQVGKGRPVPPDEHNRGTLQGSTRGAGLSRASVVSCLWTSLATTCVTDGSIVGEAAFSRPEAGSFAGAGWWPAAAVVLLLAFALASSAWLRERSWRRKAESDLRDTRRGFEAQVNEQIAELSASKLRLDEEMARREWLEACVREREQEIADRVKELQCVFGMSELVEKHGNSLGDIVQGTVNLIPPSLRNPSLTCARAIVGDDVFATDGFREGEVVLRRNVAVRNKNCGRLEVHHLGSALPAGRPVFEPHEQNLLVALAERLGRIVERVRGEGERAALHARLHQVQKMEAVGQLAAGAAHDFRNLLAVIRGHLEQAAESLPMDHPATVALGSVREASDQAIGLTRSLLTVGQSVESKKSVVDLRALVEEGARLARHVFPDDLALHLDLGGAPIWVCANPSQLQQVVLNLAINARDATPGGGTFDIRARIVSRGLEESDSCSHAAQTMASLTFHDSGSGIAENHIGRIFEPFFTTKPRGDGTGLGLAIVHGIVSKHGGKVEVQSELNRGTTFTITLPLVTEKEQRRATSRSAPPHGAGEQVLLVEADPHIGGILAMTIQSLGYDVTHVDGATQAEAVLRDPANHIRLLVIDMPDGLRTNEDSLSPLRQIAGDVPAVLIAGECVNDASARDELTWVLRRPFDMYQLACCIRRAIPHSAVEAPHS